MIVNSQEELSVAYLKEKETNARLRKLVKLLLEILSERKATETENKARDFFLQGGPDMPDRALEDWILKNKNQSIGDRHS